MRNSALIVPSSENLVSAISLYLASNSLAGAIIRVEVRDVTGTQIIASTSQSFAVGESPNGWVNFSFPSSASLIHGVKYRIYVTRQANTTGVITWAGANSGEWYAPGQNSTGNGDFNFATYSITGGRGQACFAGINGGANLIVGQPLWQEFIPGDARIVLRNVDLKLRVNLYSSEKLFVDIRDTNGTVLATSLSSPSGEYGDYWVHFTLEDGIVLNKTQRYQIYARRSGFPSYFEPWMGVFLHYTTYDSYPHGNPVGAIDYAFKTDANGFPDQQQLNHNGFYPDPLTMEHKLSPRQEFTPGA